MSGTLPASGAFVQPGEIAVGGGETTLTAIVGSCVVVCLRDSTGTAGGMAHFLLPHGSGDGNARNRFANHAVPELIERVRRLAAQPARLEAKLVGGASVLSSLKGKSRRLGENNLEAARQQLSEAGLGISVEVVGREFGRKVIYEVHDGSMWVHELKAETRGQ